MLLRAPFFIRLLDSSGLLTLTSALLAILAILAWKARTDTWLHRQRLRVVLGLSVSLGLWSIAIAASYIVVVQRTDGKLRCNVGMLLGSGSFKMEDGSIATLDWHAWANIVNNSSSTIRLETLRYRALGRPGQSTAAEIGPYKVMTARKRPTYLGSDDIPPHSIVVRGMAEEDHLWVTWDD